MRSVAAPCSGRIFSQIDFRPCLDVSRSLSVISWALGYEFDSGFYILFGSWDSAIHSWVAGEYEGEGALRVPAWPTRFTILFGSAVATFSYLLMAYLDVFRPQDLDAEVDPEAKFHG